MGFFISNTLFFFAIAAATSILIPTAVKIAARLRFLDHPDDDRKDHTRPVPPVGGIIIVPLFIVLLPVMGFNPGHDWSLPIALLLMLAVGVWDDRHNLNASVKLLLQILIAALPVLSGQAVLTDLGHLFGAEKTLHLGVIGIPFTIVCFVFLINAMNMIDGVDGLAGGLAAVMLGWLAYAAARGGEDIRALQIILMMALLAGFLTHNMRYPGHRKATLFLGDAGSMALGVLIAYYAVRVSQAETPGLVPIAVGWIILIPIADAFALFIARLRAGRRAFTPGHDHLHHRFLNVGFRPGQVTVILLATAFITGALGVLGPRVGVGEGAQTVLWLLALLAHTLFLARRGRARYETTPVDKDVRPRRAA